ncbi:hypothetical protein JMJ56_24965 [Belnapia sp. T18]|uniref:Uncharacterized protein n=1 Tax=Belnapia arida TaxID=2804533 RepID=A0ABS1UDC3_9PROT|nr:hypothetical protein [Belnapia arida]MBL6081251.1 hypothetical protein [Belnapia arida]
MTIVLGGDVSRISGDQVLGMLRRIADELQSTGDERFPILNSAKEGGLEREIADPESLSTCSTRWNACGAVAAWAAAAGRPAAGDLDGLLRRVPWMPDRHGR